MCRRKGIAMLKERVAVACADGAWDYDPYFHGYTNGMICALSLADGKAPVFLSAPDRWLGEDPLYKIAWRRFKRWAEG